LKARRLTYAVVILLAAMAAAVGYAYFSHPGSLLILQVKTYEKGVRRVTVAAVNGRIHERKFEIGNDLGEPSFYTVALPRAIPDAITIDPLATRGRFEIDVVTLKCEAVSYSWDRSGICSRKTMPNGVIKREPCGDGQPLLTMSDKSQLVISRLPADAYPLNITRGLLAGLGSLIAVILAGLWLARPVKAEESQSAVMAYPARLCWLAVLVVYLLQFSVIWHYSVDLPFWEEWEYFLPGGLPDGLSWDWLFSFAGYHRVVPTKFMAWLNLQLFGLDFNLQVLFNYFIFGCLLVALIRLKNRLIGRHEFALFPAFLLFLLSPIAYENHSNSYQSQIHLVIILALAAIFHIYDEKLKAKSLALFLLCLVAAINTFSAGMTIAAVLLPCWALFVMVQISAGRVGKQKGLLLLLLGGAVVSVAAASWIFGYRQPADSIWISPFNSRFWDTFFNLLSFGFGFETELILPGVICLLVVVLPFILIWKNREQRRQPAIWQLTTGVLVFVAILVTIAVTRGNFIGTAKMSRYAEFGLILIPLTSVAWWLALRSTVRRYTVLLLLWGACFISFFDDWSYSPYRDAVQMSTFVLDALEEYTLGRGDGVYPWTHPKPLPPFFEGARQLDVKFTRQFKGL